MKILICSDVFPGLSGIANYTKEISNILKKNHHIEILCFKKENQKIKSLEKDILIHRLNEDSKEIDNFFKKNKNNFDVVLVRTFPFLSSVKYFKNVIYILPSVRSISLRIINYQNKERAKEIIKQEIEGILKCKKIIYPSLAIKKQVENEYHIKKGIVIPHAVNLKKFKPSSEKKIYDILTVANFDPRKGIDKLIKTAQYSSANFIVLGDGPLREEYENLIKKNNLNNLKLLGKKDSKEYYSKSKIYVLPSRYEAFGLVLLEAMASGLPCIAFKPNKDILTASDEIIEDGVTGFLVKNEKEMAEKINLLLSNNKLREKMGKEARKEAKKYSLENYIPKLMKVVNISNN